MATTDRGPIRRRWTVIELEKHPSGEWRATEAGASTWASGETAAEAAAAYCARVAADATGSGDQSDPSPSRSASGS